MSQKNFIKEVFKILSALSLWQNRGALVLDWIPFLPQKLRRFLKIVNIISFMAKSWHM